MSQVKKKNVVYILIDSLSWEAVGTNYCKVSPTPFLDSLKNESFVATNMFSQGPYTDAATKGLYTGENTLDNEGYYFRLNTAKDTNFKIFKRNGYHTIGFYYPFYMYGKEIRENIDEKYFTSCFEFGSEWGGTFEYYSTIIKNRKLNNTEIVLLSRRLELMFDVWIDFYNNIINDKQTSLMISNCLLKFDVKSSLKILEKEYNEFLKNKEDYIYAFLGHDKKKIFDNIDKIDIDCNINRDFIDNVFFNEYREFLRLANNSHNRVLRRNFKFLSNSFASIFNLFRKRDINYLRFFKNYFKGFNGVSKEIKKSRNCKWQYVPSAGKQLEFAEQVLDSYKGDDPFYLSIHLEDLHGDISFFSFDSFNEKKIDNEMKILGKFVADLKTDFDGNLVYYLSLRYTDYCIENFVEKLKEKRIWDDTILVVVADHGHPNIGYPVRLKGKLVNSFFKENYHIPLIIRNPNWKNGIQFDGFANSKDILPTICDILGLDNDLPNKISLINNFKNNNFIITEYFGPGCPDYSSKEIWFSIITNFYSISYKVKLHDDFSCGELCEVYNLLKDPLELKNLVNKIDKEAIKESLSILEKRFNQIKKDYDIQENI